LRDVSACAWNMSKIRIVGVHHRHQMSIADVEDAIAEHKPDIVCVELPSDDYLKFLEVRSYLETEMKIAMVTACEIGAKVCLIDLTKEYIERRLRETLRLKDPRLWLEFENGDIPAFYRRLREVAPASIDRAKEVLLLDREAAMAAKLLSLAEKYPGSRILAVVGYSHKPAIEEFLKDRKKLSDILKNRGILVDEPHFLDCEEVMIYS